MKAVRGQLIHLGRALLEHRRTKTLSSTQQPRNSQEAGRASVKVGRSWRVSLGASRASAGTWWPRCQEFYTVAGLRLLGKNSCGNRADAGRLVRSPVQTEPMAQSTEDSGQGGK